MRVDVLTIFPAYLEPLRLSLLGKARDRGMVEIHTRDLRDWATDRHRTVDDTPYGGGPGMVMRPEPWDAALRSIAGSGGPAPRPRVIVPTPAGRPFTQAYAAELAAEPWLVFCCGRYEGIDARIVDAWADDEVSIGDYVLSGGEVATLVMLEAITRLLPGAVGNAESVTDDSFAHGLLEGPVYTRPPEWAGHRVPDVLLSGDHGAIARWRREQALRRTAQRRPDLLTSLELDDRDRLVVAQALARESHPPAGAASAVAESAEPDEPLRTAVDAAPRDTVPRDTASRAE
ncbi:MULTISPECIES: tRNA (guanosine(37)-N1)-methyltransferase TrmD [unclassified Pseudofrankia]|uniref:tRNA (guanosine(37)-N1)-methyltransferase TrmD n=1 Tax=unclassified Pseudofrankia TaxID=2994372 RepID=UPI000B0514A4|nr:MULTISPECIES: tRNA (guanosine(37)-N1)-methyltransferase TrmD [unclassified Pseudofrankia]MDT3443788.1 tRNA (guanosine(37)-N1)-methyltransferase TrmD [Pseudofrankia sp. BMG5.37]